MLFTTIFSHVRFFCEATCLRIGLSPQFSRMFISFAMPRVNFFSGYHKILQKLPGFKIEKNGNFFDILNKKIRKWLEIAVLEPKKREKCVVSQLHALKIRKNFNVLVFKTRHFT
jgi:hypothetical protein